MTRPALSNLIVSLLLLACGFWFVFVLTGAYLGNPRLAIWATIGVCAVTAALWAWYLIGVRYYLRDDDD